MNDIINLKLNNEGVYNVTDDVEEDIIDEHEYKAPVNEFVDGIFMGLNVSDFINKVIRRVI